MPQIDLSWTDTNDVSIPNNTNEDGYRIYKSTNSLVGSIPDTLPAPLVTLPVNTIAYSDTNLIANTIYYYVLETFIGTVRKFSPEIARKAAPNSPPTITIEDIPVNYGVEWNPIIINTDIDGDTPITNTLTNSPVGMYIDAINNKIIWPNPIPGNYTFTITATDGFGGETTIQVANLIVDSLRPVESINTSFILDIPNSPPVIDDISRSIDVDIPFIPIQLTAVDAENDTLSWFFLNGNLTEGDYELTNTGVLTSSNVDLGTDVITVFCNDEYNIVSKIITFQIISLTFPINLNSSIILDIPNTAPVIDDVSRFIDVDVGFDPIQLTAVNAENDILTWTLTGFGSTVGDYNITNDGILTNIAGSLQSGNIDNVLIQCSDSYNVVSDIMNFNLVKLFPPANITSTITLP